MEDIHLGNKSQCVCKLALPQKYPCIHQYFMMIFSLTSSWSDVPHGHTKAWISTAKVSLKQEDEANLIQE